MSRSRAKGSMILTTLLEELGIQVVFGMPGSESVELFEALRQSSLRTILTTNETAAAFMAQGFYRASGRIAAVCAIAGPGFTCTLTGLAEAHHDSAGLLCLVTGHSRFPEKKFQLQVIDQQAMAGPVIKKGYQITGPDDIASTICNAYACATTGEPGPVLIEITSSALTAAGEVPRERPSAEVFSNPIPRDEHFDEVTGLLSQAARIVLYAGQGAAAAAERVRQLAEFLGSPVLTTCSGRGIIPEEHPLSFYFDYSWGKGGETVNQLLAESDLVLALGCKFTHNGTGGFRLKIPAEKLVHVDAANEVLGANYPARCMVLADVRVFLERLIGRRGQFADRPPGWTNDELKVWHERLTTEKKKITRSTPQLTSDDSRDCTAFFAALRDSLPNDVCLVTDSGLHQVLARNHFAVCSPRGMIVPTDFQSMGFGIPAAIGAKMAAPGRPVVAIIGDGGFTMSGMELATAVREKIPLTVIVFSDGYLGSIRLLQFENCGREYAVGLQNPDFDRFAQSLGVAYGRWDNLERQGLAEFLAQPGVKLLEVPLKDSPAIHKLRRDGLARGAVRDLIGPRMTEIVKKWLGR